jgi:hypothetical protein
MYQNGDLRMIGGKPLQFETWVVLNKYICGIAKVRGTVTKMKCYEAVTMTLVFTGNVHLNYQLLSKSDEHIFVMSLKHETNGRTGGKLRVFSLTIYSSF